MTNQDLKPAAHGLKRYDWQVNGVGYFAEPRMVERKDGEFVKFADLPPLLSPPRAGMTEALRELVAYIDRREARVKDWACAECGGEPFKGHEGFKCAYHHALTFLASPILMEQIQGPREWDAESIKDAPEGKYYASDDDGKTWETYWADQKCGDFDTGHLVVYDKADCVQGSATSARKTHIRWFGPVTQPPEKQP